MKLDLREERVRLDFPNALALYKFDERERLSPTFHGAPMKAVDVLAEFPTFQLWIEIKEYTPEEIQEMKDERDKGKPGELHHKTWLVNNFKYKFRDTFLYRFCEEKIDLPVVYVCLTNFDHALNIFFRRQLINQLPTGKVMPDRWRKELIAKNHVFVVDEGDWQRNLEQKFGTCVRY